MKIIDIIKDKYECAKIDYKMNKTTSDCSYYMGYQDALGELIERINNEILEEKKIPEKLENEHEFYSYAKYEENKNEIDKVLYILKAINLTEEKIGNLNNSVNEIIDYLKSKGDE